jgi:hypothetical protein
MSRTLHIIRKDLRRMRWLLVAWVVVIIGRLVLTAAGSIVEPEDFGLQLIVENLSGLAGFVEMLMWGLLVSWLVHDEPLVGADAFWLTRPIEPNGLMMAKLVLAGVFLILCPLARETLEMGWFGAHVRDVTVAATSFVFTQTFWVLLLLAAAVLTPSLTRFVLTIAAGVAAFVMAIGAMMTLLVLIQPEEQAYYDGPMIQDSTANIVGSVLVMCVAFGVIVYQYRHRRLRRAILIGAGGLIAAAIATSMWPWHFAGGVEADPGPWAQDRTRTIAVLDVTRPPHVSEAYSFRRARTPKKQVAAPIDLIGAPADYFVESAGVRARLTFPDGTTIQSAQRESATIPHPSTDRSFGRSTHIRAVLGDVRLSPDTADNYEMLPVVLRVTDSDYQRYGEQAGHLTATVDFQLNRFRVFGTLPLSAGAVVRDKTDRLEIVRVRRRSDGCDVLVRQFAVAPLWAAKSPRQFQYVLRNAGRGEAIAGDSEGTFPHGQFNVGALFGLSIYGSGSGQPFSEWSQTLRYPTRASSSSPAGRIDAAWLDAAELVVIESVYAGRVTRSLDVDGFRMRPTDR